MNLSPLGYLRLVEIVLSKIRPSVSATIFYFHTPGRRLLYTCRPVFVCGEIVRAMKSNAFNKQTVDRAEVKHEHNNNQLCVNRVD